MVLAVDCQSGPYFGNGGMGLAGRAQRAKQGCKIPF